MIPSRFDRMTRSCVACFATAVTYLRDGEETPIQGVFDNDYEDVSFDDGAAIMSRSPALGIHKDALPFSPKKGDQVRVGDVLYRVKKWEPDSEYGIQLVLAKA